MRLSTPHATAVGAKLPGTNRLYEFTFGAKHSVSSRRQASWPARKCSITGDIPCAPPPANADVSDSTSRRLMWMWHELPSRWSNFAMNVRLQPSWCAISLAPVL